MGFWQTGYLEFHEMSGLDWTFDPRPVQYSCSSCGATFQSSDDLQEHRFSQHPARRPLLIVRGQEVGNQPLRVARVLRQNDIQTEHSDRIRLNGAPLTLRELQVHLSRITNERCRIVLSHADIDVAFDLDVCVASSSDMLGVERAFGRMARRHFLDTRTIEQFIEDTMTFSTVRSYVDGICTYLYGVLEKERADDVTLPFETYISKFNGALDRLSPYDRGLARSISAVIAFHFNQFAEAAACMPAGRIGNVSARFARCVEAGHPMSTSALVQSPGVDIDGFVTDFATEQVIQLACKSLAVLGRDALEVEGMLERASIEYDKVKLHVLLGEAFLAAGDRAGADRHLKALRNVASLERWATGIVERIATMPPRV